MKYHRLPSSVVPWVLLVIALTAFESSRAALLLYEPFSTTTFSAADTKLGRVTGQWNLGNNTDANDGWSMVRSTAALSYSSLVTSNGSRGVARIPNTYAANRNIGAPWATAVTSGSVYCSFLINVTTPPQANRALLLLSLFSSGNIAARNDGCGAVAWLNSNRQLQVGKYSTSVLAPATTPALEPGVTYLVVLKYTFNPRAGDDVVALFLNPVTTGAEPGSPTISTAAGADSSQMKSVWLPQSQSPEFGSHTGEIRMDEIRVGDTWADVLPSDGTPPPAVRVPRITEVLLSGSDLVLSGTNGPPSGGYQVLRSPDLSQPVEGWSGIGIESFDSSGDFSFTNRLPADTANFYRLRVISSVPISAPVITTQPQDLAIEVGVNATFNVTATGSEPLTYRWYFNTNTVLAGKTNSTLTLTNVQLTNAGTYSVTITNLYGSTNSGFAALTVYSNVHSQLIGWASVAGYGQATTTGGGTNAPILVTDVATLRSLAGDSTPRVLELSGTFVTGSSAITIGNNKTLRGVGPKVVIQGGIDINTESNIIIQNLTIQGNGYGFAPSDTAASRASHHLWFDHVTFSDAGDGLLDLTVGSDFITVSWCKFFYTDPNNTHRLCSLVGNSSTATNTDTGKNNVTYHHNWFAELVDQRMPRLLFGKGHMFNNYYNSPGNGYCIGTGSWGSALVENNYFKQVNSPHQSQDGNPSYIAASGNVYDNTTGNRHTGLLNPDNDGKDPGPWIPPYSYTLEPVANVPSMVTAGAGPQSVSR